MHDSNEMTRTPAVEAVDLSKTYQRRRPEDPEFALSSLSLRVLPGEVALLVGPNGAGKSTALRLLAGVEEPTRGLVRILGDSPRSMEVRRRVAYLADASELFPFLDTFETLDFFAASADLSLAEGRRRSDELADLLGMKAWGRKRVRTFSLGMRRRLGLACVLISQPDVLLLDEPAAGLDPDGLRLFGDVVEREKARGCAMVMSSHHLGHAQAFSDWWVVLDDGQVRLEGSRADIAAGVGKLDVTVSGMSDSALEGLKARIAELGGEWEGQRLSEEGLEDFILGDREEHE